MIMFKHLGVIICGISQRCLKHDEVVVAAYILSFISCKLPRQQGNKLAYFSSMWGVLIFFHVLFQLD